LLEIAQSFVLRREASLLKKYLPPKCEPLVRDSGESLHEIQDEYVVFITPTNVQTKILMKILNKDNVDPLIKNNMTDSLAMMSLLQKICNSPILLKATADKNKGRENQGANANAILDALAYLPARPQVEDVSLSGLASSFFLIGMYTDASIRETYGTR
jgi:DNA repair and recombination protein RAD54B